MGHQLMDKMTFKDEQNKLEAVVEFASERWKEQDYLSGKILENGKVVSKITGNYMGYIDFDGARYWDAREIDQWCFRLNDWDFNPLPSDSSRRLDIVKFTTKNADEAQIEKDILQSQNNKDQ